MRILILVVCVSAGILLGEKSPSDPGASARSNAELVERATENEIRMATIVEGTSRIELPEGEDFYLLVTNLDRDPSPVRIQLAPATREELTAVRWRVRPAFEPRPLRSSEDKTLFSLVSHRTASPEVPTADEPRRFFLHVGNGPLEAPENYVAVQADLVARGSRVRIFLDRQRERDEAVDRLAARTLAELERLIPEMERRLGPFADVDEDGAIAVLLTPWLNRLQGGRTTLKGFVRGSDFQTHLLPPLSNSADIVYLNSELGDDENLRTLLAHELLHLLGFSLRSPPAGDPLPVEEDWLSEAEAHLAENLFGGDGSNLRHRLTAFLADPGGTPLVVTDYYRSGLWRDDRCRGATYLFLRWCCDRYGDALLSELLTASGTGARNLEAVTGVDFATLQQEWALALLAARDRGVDSVAGYRYFYDEAGRRNFGDAPLDELAVPVAALRDTAWQTSLAGTATVFVRIPREATRAVQVRCYPPRPLRITLVPAVCAPESAASVTASSIPGR